MVFEEITSNVEKKWLWKLLFLFLFNRLGPRADLQSCNWWKKLWKYHLSISCGLLEAEGPKVLSSMFYQMSSNRWWSASIVYMSGYFCNWCCAQQLDKIIMIQFGMIWYKWIVVISSRDAYGCMTKNGTRVMCNNTYTFIHGGTQFTLYPKKP